MDTPQPQPANTDANIRKAAEAIAEVLRMKQELIRCHDFPTNNTQRLVELLCQAETRGYLLEDALTLVDTTYWLQMIDWQSKFLTLILSFTKDPSTKSLRPLIELYGRDRERMRVEAEILERQLDLPPLNEATPGARVLGGRNQGRARNATREAGAG